MRYYSTKDKQISFSFKDAVIAGLAPDRGLFYPGKVTALSPSFLQNLSEKSLQDIGFEVASAFIEDEIPTNTLKKIVDETLNFDIPLVEVEKDIYSLELFHGPTCAFKDVGARFMARCLGYFTKESNKNFTILVATSGDTGSAVANGFYDIEGINVVILYPSGKVSEIQEKQLTGLRKNITALKIDGTFDDCQNLVKNAFMDGDLKSKINITSANSINIARLLPQSFYYFYALSQLGANDKDVVFSVPSGNYGNITAGLFAKKMGLPVHQFIAASNINKIVPDYLKTGEFIPKPSVETISNAMDVGNPSNFDRILELYHQSYEEIVKDISGYFYTDEETREAITDVFKKTGYTLDPHGAVGYLALKEYTKENQCKGIFLETAHPAKFADIVEEQKGEEINMPESLQKYVELEKKYISLSKEYSEFKDFLLKP